MPSKIDAGVKSSIPIQTNSTNEHESVLETSNQTESSKSPEACNQSDLSKSLNSDHVSIDSPPLAVQNIHESSKVVKSTELQVSGAKACNLKCTAENKLVLDNSELTVAKFQSTSLKTNSPPLHSEEASCVDTTLPKNTLKPSSKTELSKTIDLSSLSAVLEDGKNKGENPISALNNVIDEKLKYYPDQKEESLSNYFFIRARLKILIIFIL